MNPSKHHFGQAADEVARGIVSRDLLAMAVAEALGDERKANAIYIRLRATEIAHDELKNKATGVIEYCIESTSEVLRLVRIVVLFNVIGVPICLGLLFVLQVEFGVLANVGIGSLFMFSLVIPSLVGIFYEDSKYSHDNKTK